MTIIAEQEFIALWQQGLETAAIARALGIPPGTARSRAYALQQAGKIPPRPKGGRRTPARALTEGTVQNTVQSRAVQKPVQITAPVQSSVDTGAVQRLDRLEDEVQSLRQLVQALMDRLDHPPVQTPVQITALPPYPKGKAVRWNLWILDAIRDDLAALAVERGISSSQLVQELLWKALSDHRSSTA